MTPDKCPVCNGANCLYRDGGSLVVQTPKRFHLREIAWKVVSYGLTATFVLMLLLMLIAALIEAGAK